MKILIFGAGVIGTTYAWQMSEAGHDITLLVRKQRLVRYSHSGVTISCTDLRGNKAEYVQTVFRPKTVDRLDPKSPFDLIIVAVKNFQLNEVVPYISQFSGDTSILFMGQLWNEFSLIEKHLPKGRYFFAFPSMAGGGRTDNSINCYLFKKKNTIIGEPDGRQSNRLKEVYEIFNSSGLQPSISQKIIPLIKSQYVATAATHGAVMKAGGARLYATNNRMVAQSVRAMKEGMAVSKKKGISPPKIFPFSLLSFPVPVAAFFMKRSLSSEKQAMIEARMKHGHDELKKQFFDILHEGKKLGVQMPYWGSFEKHLRSQAG